MNAPVLKIFSLCFVLVLYPCRFSYGQEPEKLIQDSVHQTDIRDVFNSIFKKHRARDTIKVTGKGPFISVLPGISYGMNTGLVGNLSSSAAFYTDNEKTRISRIDLFANYSQYHQYWFDLLSSVFLRKIKLHLSGDMRYYKFPTETYGLGPGSKNSDALRVDYSFFRFWQVVFHEFRPDLFIGLGYGLDYHWNIKVDSVKGNSLDQFISYQKGNRSASSGITMNLLYDNRINPVNPQGGTFINLQFRPNMVFLGSTSGWQQLLLEFRHYIKLPASSRNILALWSYNEITVKGDPPYLDLPGIGWDAYSNTGREYAAGRFTGRDLFYLEAEYRFPITRNGLLGGVVFGNAQSIPESFKAEARKIVPGGGFGLRIKADKRSGTNLVIDYGFGIRGSHGLFFSVGEVF